MLNIKSVSIVLGGLAAAMIFSGCAPKGPQFNGVKKLQKDSGLVYVYRPSKFVGSGLYYDIHVKDTSGNDKVIGTLTNGSYLQYRSKPGEKEFWAKTESTSSVTIDIEPNKMYCVKGEIGMGLLVGRPHLTIVDNETCKKEIKDTKLSI